MSEAWPIKRAGRSGIPARLVLFLSFFWIAGCQNERAFVVHELVGSAEGRILISGEDGIPLDNCSCVRTLDNERMLVARPGRPEAWGGSYFQIPLDTPDAVKLVGKSGQGPGEFAGGPMVMQTLPDGTTLVKDASPYIQMFSPDGVYSQKIQFPDAPAYWSFHFREQSGTIVLCDNSDYRDWAVSDERKVSDRQFVFLYYQLDGDNIPSRIDEWMPLSEWYDLKDKYLAALGTERSEQVTYVEWLRQGTAIVSSISGTRFLLMDVDRKTIQPVPVHLARFKTPKTDKLQRYTSPAFAGSNGEFFHFLEAFPRGVQSPDEKADYSIHRYDSSGAYMGYCLVNALGDADFYDVFPLWGTICPDNNSFIIQEVIYEDSYDDPQGRYIRLVEYQIDDTAFVMPTTE